MNDRNIKGIALILFGILLCLVSDELNRTIFCNLGYLPFSLAGVIVGIIGVVMVFSRSRKS